MLLPGFDSPLWLPGPPSTTPTTSLCSPHQPFLTSFIISSLSLKMPAKKPLFPRHGCLFCRSTIHKRYNFNTHLDTHLSEVTNNSNNAAATDFGNHFVPIIAAVRRRSIRHIEGIPALRRSKFDACHNWKLFTLLVSCALFAPVVPFTADMCVEYRTRDEGFQGAQLAHDQPVARRSESVPASRRPRYRARLLRPVPARERTSRRRPRRLRLRRTRLRLRSILGEA